MASVSEGDGVQLNFVEQGSTLPSLDDTEETPSDDESLSEKCFTGADALYISKTTMQRNLLSTSAADTHTAERLLVDESVDRDFKFSGSDSNLDNYDVSHQTSGDLLTHDQTDVFDDLLAADGLSLEQQATKDLPNSDNSSKDNGDELMRNDTEMNEWLLGTLQHLQRNMTPEERNIGSDENELDMELDIQDEEPVEVQEFLQEEEISEETVAEDSGDSSSKEDEVPLSYDLQQGYKILREIMGNNNKSITWPFLYAVDPNAEGCHNYYEKVKNPMWLMKMKEKFEHREYESITEYVSDMRLMLENCYRFNGLTHPISRNGEKLEQMMEQKLLLLSRELRDKTSLAATSGKVVDIPITGTRRQKFSGASGSTTLLHRLRWEALEKEKEAKRQQQLAKKMAYEEFLKSLQSWEDKLFEDPLRQQMKAMWELPHIGQFLFLCEKALNMGEISQYELECSILLPRESSALQRIMTSLLSSPHQRARLQGKSLMSYRVWDEKLRQLLRQWYKTHEDNERKTKLTAIKLGLEERFFKVVGHRNPLEKKKFHELTFYQRVWILKSLCDHCLETQKSICEAIESQPLLDLRESVLGKDNDGNSYIHFPQFCGEDLRIYRQSPPVIVVEETDKENVSYTKSRFKRRRKHKYRSLMKKSILDLPEPPATSATPRIRDSRLRQNPRQIQSYQVTESSTSSETDGSTDGENDEEEEEEEEKRKEEEEQNEESEKEAEETEEKNEDDEDKEIGNEKELSETDKMENVEQEEQQPKVLRSSQKRSVTSRSRKVVDSNPLETTPCSWSSFDGSSSLIPRRSLRKIIEESKKDAIGSGSSPVVVSATPRRHSSFSSSSSAVPSRSRSESVSSVLPSGGKKVSRSSSNRGKRKRGSSSEEDDGFGEERELPAVSPRLTRSKAIQSRGAAQKQKSSEETRKTSSTRSAKKISPEPIEIGRITRNLYKALLEVKDFVNGDGQQFQETEVSGIFKGRKDNRRKKRSCLTVASNKETDPIDGMSSCGDAVGNVGLQKQKNVKKAVHNGPVAAAANDDHNSRSVESLQEIDGEGDSKVQNDLNENVKKTEKMMTDEKPIFSTSVSEDADTEETVKADEKSDLLESASENVEAKLETDDQKPLWHHREKLKAHVSSETSPENNSVDEKPLLKTLLDDVNVLPKKNSDEVADDKNDNQKYTEVKKQTGENMESIPSGKEGSVKLEAMEEEPCQLTETENIADTNLENQDTNWETAKMEDNEADEVCEILGPEIGPFELIVDSIDGLRRLVEEFAEKEEEEEELSSAVPSTQEEKAASSGCTYRKRCTIDLHKRLSCLLQEVGGYEPRLIKLNKKKMIRLRKEQENYREEPEKEQVDDIWENNDSTSCASNGNTEVTNDESSFDAESNSSKTEEKLADVQKKFRPSRKRTTLETLPSTPVSDVLIPTSSANSSSISTRKRTALGQGKSRSAKKAKVRNSSAENAKQSSKEDVLTTAPDSSFEGETAQIVKDSVLRGLISRDTVAKKKQGAGSQPVAGNNILNASRLSSTPLGKQDVFQQAISGTQRCLTASNNIPTKLVTGQSLNAGSGMLANTNRHAVSSMHQPTSRFTIGQTLQPFVQQNMLRLATSSGSGVQFLAVSNLNQLPPALLQQLLNSQNLVMVAPSETAQIASKMSSSAATHSGFVQNCMVVANNGLLTATSISQPIQPSHSTQPRLQSLPYAGLQKTPHQGSQAVLHSFQQTAQTVLSTGSGYMLPSHITSSSTAATRVLNSSAVRPFHSSSLYAGPSSGQPGLGHNMLSTLSTGDSAVHQKYTNSLTVRALLGNRSIADQIHNLLPSSLPSGHDIVISSSPNLSNFPSLAVTGNISSHIAEESLFSNQLNGGRLSNRPVNGHDNLTLSSSSSYGMAATGANSIHCIALASQSGLPSVLQSAKATSSGLLYKEGDVSVSMGLRMSKPASSSVSLRKGVQGCQSVPRVQQVTHATIGTKLIVPKDVTVPRIGNFRQPLLPVAAVVSGADQLKQIVLMSPEQAAAIARKNLVDQAVKAAITAPISTSLPTANLEIPSSCGMPPPPRNVNTQTTTVMKSPIPALPQLFNHGRSPTKPVSNISALLSPSAASRLMAVVSLNSSQTSTTLPVTLKTPVSEVQLQLSASVSGATAATEPQTGMPILLNSAIMMPGTQNVLVLQQTPVQLLSLGSNRATVTESPLKITFSMPQTIPSSLCSVVSTIQMSTPCKNAITSAISSQPIWHQPLQQSLSSSPLMHFNSAPAQSAISVQSALHLSTSHPSVQYLSPSYELVQLAQQRATNKTLPQSTTFTNPSSDQLLTPNHSQSHATARLAHVDNVKTLATPSRPAFKIVIPPNLDGVPLGQLPLQGGLRLLNRLPSGLVAVAQQNTPLPDASKTDNKTSVKLLNNPSQVNSLRLVVPSSLPQASDATVSAVPLVVLERPKTIPFKAATTQRAPGITTSASVEPSAGQVEAALLVQRSGIHRGMSNAVATPVPQVNAQTPQQIISPRQAVLQLQTNTLNVNNLKGQLVQLAVQPSIPTLQPLRGQVVQLPVQTANPSRGQTAEMQLRLSLISSTGDASRLQRPVLQMISPKRDITTVSSVLPLPSPSSRATTPVLPGLLLSNVAQANCTTASSGSSFAGSALHKQVSHLSASANTQSTSGLQIQQSMPPNARMNLEAAANWLLQAASVVDSSSGIEHNSSNQDSTTSIPPTS